MGWLNNTHQDEHMKNQFGNWFGFLILLGIVSSTALFCTMSPDAKELETVIEQKSYSFSPDTILTSLEQGNSNVFSPMLSTSEATASTPEKSVQWSQDDFYRVAQAIHAQSWGEALGTENLYYMSFDMACSDVDSGAFREAFFKSYKLVPADKEEKRIEHWITIRPQSGLIEIDALEYNPNLHIMKPIDLAQYKITADEGLRLAEMNGGREARLEIRNDCEISAFSPSVNGVVWEIFYVNYPEEIVNTLFRIAVDPITGKYNVWYPKTK
jgi:hypothetical protein